MIKDKKLINYFFEVIFIFTILILIFARSFVGIYIFGFRIGEYLVVASLVLTILALVAYLFNQDIFGKLIKVVRVHFLLVLSFIAIMFLTNSSFVSTYTYKSSSYIWTLAFIYFGYFVFKYYELKLLHLNILIFVAIIVYFNAVTRNTQIPDLIVNFFNNYSDKFERHKGSDLLMVFVITTFFSLKKLPYKRLTIDIFILLSALYLPLIMWKSKGATIGFIAYVVIQLVKNKKYFNNLLYRNIILAVLFGVLFFLSSIGISSYTNFDVPSDEAVNVVVSKKFSNNKWLLLYIEDGRLFSYDANANWRLQIWQDVIKDSLGNDLNGGPQGYKFPVDQEHNKTYLYGLGYKEIIPAMSTPNRMGWDGKNENVHNFLVQNYARGGLIHLSLFVYLFWLFLYKYNNKDRNVLIYVLPFFITSLFDASMENAHFPIIFYFFLGGLFSKSFD